MHARTAQHLGDYQCQCSQNSYFVFIYLVQQYTSVNAHRLSAAVYGTSQVCTYSCPDGVFCDDNCCIMHHALARCWKRTINSTCWVAVQYGTYLLTNIHKICTRPTSPSSLQQYEYYSMYVGTSHNSIETPEMLRQPVGTPSHFLP